jgi:hypothetical protein
MEVAFSPDATQKIVKVKKTRKSKQANTQNQLPENFIEVTESLSKIEVILPTDNYTSSNDALGTFDSQAVNGVTMEPVTVSDETTKVKKVKIPRKAQTKEEFSEAKENSIKRDVAARSKKSKKLKGFFANVGKNVSRETSKSVRFHKKKSLVGKFVSGLKSLTLIPSPIYNFAHKKNLMTGVLGLAMLGIITATTYVTYAYVSTRDEDLVSSVAKHVILPTDETPKVYIMQSEKADLFKNPLFKGIKVGDNVLTYSKAGRVIIYREGEDKIVNIVNLDH